MAMQEWASYVSPSNEEGRGASDILGSCCNRVVGRMCLRNRNHEVMARIARDTEAVEEGLLWVTERCWMRLAVTMEAHLQRIARATNDR